MRDTGLVPAAEDWWLTPPARLVVRRRARLLRAQATGRVLDLGPAGGPDALSGRASAGDRYDTVVTVLQLCRSADLDAAAANVRELLAAGGRLLFLEPSAAGGATGATQRLLAPLAPRRGPGPARDLPAALRAAGLRVTDCDRITLPMPWPWRTFVEGSAR